MELAIVDVNERIGQGRGHGLVAKKVENRKRETGNRKPVVGLLET
jgi:hypothetical protein